MNIVDLVLAIEYFVAILGSATFVLRYAWSKWWKTAEGRAVMGLHAVLAYFGLLTTLRLIYGADYPGRNVLAILGVTGFVVAVWSTTLLMFKAQRRTRRDRDDSLTPV